MTQQDNDGRMDDADLGRVLRAAGRRVRPSEEATHAIREAVRAEWRQTVARHRMRRRRRVGLAAAAVLGLLAVGAWLGGARLTAPGPVVARIVKLEGEVRRTVGPLRVWREAGEQLPLATGDELMTGANGRVALVFGEGLSVRLDYGSHIELAAADRVVVRRGAVYVDSGRTAGIGTELELETPAGTVRHLGTQYEVRLLEPGTPLIIVRVREGRVAVDRPRAATLRAEAGEQLTVSADGTVERGTVPLYGDAWRWAMEAAPEFEIEGRRLTEFLEWAGRELGRPIVYATPEAELAAAEVVLSGSITGLTPEEALAAVLATTRLRRAERDGALVIEVESAAN